jgi:glycerol-3-phosphate O-acyltransferase / dihydroxyacetone phosphate acyltransferase
MRAGPRVIDRIAAIVAHLFYRIDCVGQLPPDGAIVLLPNHANALLDPALVMTTCGRAVRFLAKSTLFGGPLAPVLKAAGAMPVYRRQDGVDVAQNDRTFVEVHAALRRGEAICIFPEGISHSTGRLEPLRTGAARMALGAAGEGIAVHLVPVGINLEQKTTFRSRVTVAYGEPIPVRPTTHATEANGVKSLTREIATHMRALLIEADPRGDADLVDRIDRLYRSERAQDRDPQRALLRRRRIADAVHRLRQEQPEWYGTALVELRRYDDRLRRFGLRDAALDWEITPGAATRFAAREIPIAILLLPLALVSVAVFAVPYMLTASAARLSRSMDVTATAKVIAGAVIYGAWVALLVGAAGVAGDARHALATLLGLPLLAVAGLFAVERETAALRTARAWLAVRSARPTTRTALRRRRAELATVLDAVDAWMTTGTATAAGTIAQTPGPAPASKD